nr:hypothetical protein [Hymenobacter sp. BT730]
MRRAPAAGAGAAPTRPGLEQGQLLLALFEPIEHNAGLGVVLPRLPQAF